MHPSHVRIVLRSQRRRHDDDVPSSIEELVIQGPWESILQMLESTTRPLLESTIRPLLANDDEDHELVINGTGAAISEVLWRMPEDRFTVLKHHADMPATAADMTLARSFGPGELILAGTGATISEIIWWMPEDHFTAHMDCGNGPLIGTVDTTSPMEQVTLFPMQPGTNQTNGYHKDSEETTANSVEEN